MGEPMSLCDALPGFLTNRRGEGRRPMGVRRYGDRLRRFAKWLGPRPLTSLDPLTIADYRDYLAETCAVATVINALSAIRALAKWAIPRGFMADDPTAAIVWPRRARRAPRPLRRSELRRLWAILADDPNQLLAERWQTRRNRLVCALMYYAGLRLGEVARLRWGDIELSASILEIRDGKGGRDRSVPLHPELLAEIASWAADQRNHAPVVVSGRGGPMRAGSIAHIFERWLPARGLRFSAHQLRHSFATEYLRATRDLRGLQILLGHESIETTQSYTLVVADDQRANVALLPSLGALV